MDTLAHEPQSVRDDEGLIRKRHGKMRSVDLLLIDAAHAKLSRIARHSTITVGEAFVDCDRLLSGRLRSPSSSTC